MKKIIISIMVYTLLLTPLLPAFSVAQEECCEDEAACEQLLEEASNDISSIEAELITTQAELATLKNDPPDIPLNGLFQSFDWYRKLPKPAKIAISTVLTAGVLYGMTYIENKPE